MRLSFGGIGGYLINKFVKQTKIDSRLAHKAGLDQVGLVEAEPEEWAGCAGILRKADAAMWQEQPGLDPSHRVIDQGCELLPLLVRNVALLDECLPERMQLAVESGAKRILIPSDADNLYITVTARSLNDKAKIITRAGQQRYANAIRNSGANEVIIPEYEGGLMTGRMIQKYCPAQGRME